MEKYNYIYFQLKFIISIIYECRPQSTEVLAVLKTLSPVLTTDILRHIHNLSDIFEISFTRITASNCSS